MKIAVTYEDGRVFQHFGHTKSFKVYTVENGKVNDTSILDAGGNGHGALAGFLKQSQVEALICGGIGAGAKQALAEAGIQLYGGTSGDADQVVTDLLSDRLVYNPDVACNNHHGHDHSHGTGYGDSCANSRMD